MLQCLSSDVTNNIALTLSRFMYITISCVWFYHTSYGIARFINAQMSIIHDKTICKTILTS